MTDYDPRRHRRRSIRLPAYDYAEPGTYFLTLCAARREPLFGQLVAGRIIPSRAGRIVAEEWLRTAEIRAGVILDEWIVMPDHMHAIVVITDAVQRPVIRRGDPPVAPATRDPPVIPGGDRPVAPTTAFGAFNPTPRAPHVGGAGDASAGGVRPGPAPASIGAIVAGFKASATLRINIDRGTPRRPVWQRNYYETVVRSQRSLDLLRAYIASNPSRLAETERLAAIERGLVDTFPGAARRRAQHGGRRPTGDS